MKYTFVVAIEGCGRIAHHIVVSEGWPVAESNADAIRELATQGVVTAAAAESVATAVGLRNVLVHQYTDIDDDRIVANLEHFRTRQCTDAVGSMLVRRGPAAP